MNTLNIIKFFIFRDMKKSLKVSLTYSNTKHVLILLQRYLYIWEWKRFTFLWRLKASTADGRRSGKCQRAGFRKRRTRCK